MKLSKYHDLIKLSKYHDLMKLSRVYGNSYGGIHQCLRRKKWVSLSLRIIVQGPILFEVLVEFFLYILRSCHHYLVCDTRLMSE